MIIHFILLIMFSCGMRAMDNNSASQPATGNDRQSGLYHGQPACASNPRQPSAASASLAALPSYVGGCLAFEMQQEQKDKELVHWYWSQRRRQPGFTFNFTYNTLERIELE